MTFYTKLISFFNVPALCRGFVLFFNKIRACLKPRKTLFGIGLAVLITAPVHYPSFAYPAPITHEPVQACVVARNVDLTNALRAQFAQCLGWHSEESSPLCLGAYQPITIEPLAQPEEVRILADNVSFYREKRSTLSGHVEVQQTQKIVNAQTAYIYRDNNTGKVTKIEFLGEVHYLEPDKLMIARKATINPQDNSGQTEDVLYRFNTGRKNTLLPSWGRASLIQRFTNKNYFLKQATYSTCAPQDKAWDIQAESITLDDAHAEGVARNARLRIREWPVLYTPYLTFPTSKARKSGFLIPMIGYSNIGGFDFGIPYYWNIAPNYDLTLIPHAYSERGVMLGGEFRFLTSNSIGKINANILPHDRAYSNFLNNNVLDYPELINSPTDRWAVSALDTTRLAPDLELHVNLQQVSDDYYLQDFSSNLAAMTQRQLLRQVDLTYTTDNWLFRGMGQSYQTLHPVNESPVADVYERLPQLMARGFYSDLPFNGQLTMLGQYDQFHWPTNDWVNPLYASPQGPRFHLNPIIAFPQVAPWGYVTPAIQVVENYYSVNNNESLSDAYYNRTIPRYSVDSGLYFERQSQLGHGSYTQTLEPRLFYLNVPYQNQAPIPVYDSGYMIFNADQLFRTNRYSGFDRIGDTNQLSYAATTRWLANATGMERANFTIGQIKYFANRRVQLCQDLSGFCLDNPESFGYLSPTAEYSPVATRLGYNFNSVWGITGDYVWNPATRATNNGDLNLHYQPESNRIIAIGYSYLFNGDVTQVRNNTGVNNALHQATFSYTWPLSDRWSTVGAYSHNISKNYAMMTLAGVQYDSCCWAMRVLGGRTFQSLSTTYQPQYNNNVYLQVLLKGLGSLSTSDPYNILSTYIPGYNDQFRR